jgi:hypothetical protein
MNSTGFSKGKCILKGEMVGLLKTSRDLQMLFAAVTHLVEGLKLETVLTLKV